MPEPIATDITSADTTAGDSTSTLYRAAIGSISTDYYLPIFTRFEAADRIGMRWNWAAGLCTLNWLAYRRLWGAALVYSGAIVAVALMVFGIGRLVLQLSQTLEFALVLTLALAAFVVPGFFGNAIFYTACRKRMAHALSVSATLEDACAMLLRRSGSRAGLVGLALANAAIAGVVVSGYVVFPKAATAPVAAVAPPTLPIVVAPAPAPVASPPMPEAPAPVPADSALPAVASAPIASPEVSVEKVEVIEPVPPPPKPVEVIAPPQKPAPPPASVVVKKAAVDKAPPKVPAKTGKVSGDDAPYFINVGLFADDNNARNARVKLTDAGFAAFTLELKTSKGLLTRVRVGPFGSETAAESAQVKIRAMGLEALIIQP